MVYHLSRHQWYIVVVVAILALIALFILVVQPYRARSKALASIAGKGELIQMYDQALSREAELKKRPDNVELYFAAGLNWKSLGDATGSRYFYERSLSVYDKGKRHKKAVSALLYLNAGNVHRLLGNYGAADENYKKAIDLNTGDPQMWLAEIDLYRHWDKKKSEEVLVLFDRALASLLESMPVSIERASYLAEIGEYAEALKIYEAIRVALPRQPGVVEKIQGLKYRIEQKKITDS